MAEYEALEGTKYDGETGASNGTLVYLPRSSINDLQLSYEFRFSAGLSKIEYLAHVNATSGEVMVKALIHQNFSYLTCHEIGYGGPALACPAPGSPGYIPVRLYAVPAAAGYPCPPDSAAILCQNAGAKNVYEVLNELKVILPAAVATNPSGGAGCCTQTGTVHAVQNSTISYGTSARGSTMYFKGADNASGEIVAHEFAHVIHHKYNDLLTNATIDARFADAVKEGLGYTIAGLYGKLSSTPAKFGEQWVYGDGPFYSGPVMRSDHPDFKYWQDITLQRSVHEVGQVVFRYFRRLQEISGVGDQRLLGIAIGTLTGIGDAEGQGIDAGDFRKAILRTIHPNETQLINAVHTVYAELYKPADAGPKGPPLPPGDPGPTGSPLAPVSHWGSFSSCGTYQGTAVSIYQTWWSASTGATEYGLFAKGNNEAAHRYTGTAFATTSYIYTNIPGEGRVNACNLYGCSGLTLDRVVVTHQSQCNW